MVGDFPFILKLTEITNKMEQSKYEIEKLKHELTIQKNRMEAFARYVREMRDYQRAYFRQRSETALRAAKTKERYVDTRVNEILEEKTLF